jgi:hypothetical protein
MNKLLKATALSIVAILILYMPMNGQEKKDSVRMLKNTIRVNLTSPMIFGDKYNVIGYERVIGHHQSFTVNMGRFTLPKFINPDIDSLQLQSGTSDKGFTIAADYRFYLKKENRYDAPRGVYIGPYYAFNTFVRTNTWTMDTQNGPENLTTELHLNMNMIGGQLGYQFVIKRRIAIDLILLGPGVWFYNLHTDVTSSLSSEDAAKVVEKINEMLAEKLPGHEITIPTEDLQKSGSITTKTAGFRYLVHLGFRF